MTIEPYLFFNGRCQEALDFYQEALGAEVPMLMRFKDSPEQDMIPPGAEDKIMHANMTIGDQTIMVSDGQGSGPTNFQGFSLSLTLTDSAEAERLFSALSQGGRVQMPLGKTFWSPCFGITSDKFGLSWMVNVLE